MSELQERQTYSGFRSYLDAKITESSPEDLAFLTHYLQNSRNGVARYYKENALRFLHKISDIEIQQLLPINFDVPFPPPLNYDFTFIDLFAGIGGFRIPIQQMNGKCVFTSEFNPYAQQTYENNFGEVPFGDITRIDPSSVPHHDLLTAGFPCQPFSISGKMKGFEDTRGTLIYNVFQIISLRKPKVVVLENVKHLVHHDRGRTLSTILRHLDELGYKVSWQILNASDFGVPQNRERIIIVAHKRKLFDFNLLEKKPKKPLVSFLDKDAHFEYLDEPYTILSNHREQKSGLIFIGYRNKKIRKAGVRPGTEHLSRVHKQPNRIYSSQGLHPALPSQESSGRFWIYHEGKVRKLTIDECYRIMGFPDDFRKSYLLGEAYKQIGNSVCVPMIRELVRQIRNQLL